MRNSVFYTMGQAERRGRLKCSSWPNLDWSNQWIHFFEQDEFDRMIAMDARSGKLQKALGIYDHASVRIVAETEVRNQDVIDEASAEEYVRQIRERGEAKKALRNAMKDWIEDVKKT